MKLKVREITNPIDVKIGMKAIPAHLINEKDNLKWIGKISFIDYKIDNKYKLQFNFKLDNSNEYYSYRYKLYQLIFIIEDDGLVCKKNKCN